MHGEYVRNNNKKNMVGKQNQSQDGSAILTLLGSGHQKPA
jgi:hypothetical protein